MAARSSSRDSEGSSEAPHSGSHPASAPSGAAPGGAGAARRGLAALRGAWLRLLERFGPRTLLPGIVLVGGLLGTTALVVVRPTPPVEPPVVRPPVVEVVEVAPRPVRMRVHAQGTVQPRTETALVAEVPGRVVWVAPHFEPGGTFAAGEPLLRLATRDHENAVRRARAAVERAESALALAEATLARRRGLRKAGASSPAALDEAESRARIAAADLADARAALDQAEYDLARCTLRAPFEGRVRETRTDVGAYLAPGTPVARLYAVDYAEVRLPLRSEDLAFLALPDGWLLPGGGRAAPGAGARGTSAPHAADAPPPAAEGGAEDGTDPGADPGTDRQAARSAGEPEPGLQGPRVRLQGRFAGREATWPARLVRVEGALDARTRMVHAVARVKDPYARREERPPLPVGLYVEAEIEGRAFDALVELPRGALREGDEVIVVDADSRLQRRPVEVVRVGREHVHVRGGLRAGERVAVTRLDVVVDGMTVRAVAREPAPPRRGGAAEPAVARAGAAP